MASSELEQARQWYADLLVALAPAPGEEPTPQGMREGYEKACAEIRVPDDVSYETTEVGGVPGEWSTASDAGPERTIIYLHPGGYSVGSAKGHRHIAGAYSRASGARVLALDYRLAPEHPHPAAVEDVVAAFDSLLQAGTPAESITILGESAGGGLSLASLVALRDREGAVPACGVAVSPWTDLTLSGDSMDSKAGEDPVNSREMLSGLAAGYLMGGDPRAPLASPLFADLTGLPPLMVMAGSAEVLLDDAVRFAETAEQAGVETELVIAPEMFHAWTDFEWFLPEANEAIERIADFVRARAAEAVPS
jgi:epsilon-lactone hydrolase